MHKIFTLTLFATFLVLTVPYPSSSEPLYVYEHAHAPQYEDNHQNQEAFLDCLAWKFNLVATLYAKINQSALHNAYKDEKEYKSPDFLFRRMPLSDDYLNKVLPASTAKKIVETIIKREGGFCSKELLYQTPCVFNSKEGAIHDATLAGSLDKIFFSRITDIIIDDPTVNQLYSFLNEHIDEYKLKFPDKNGKDHYGYSVYNTLHCGATKCFDRILYQIESNFGLCMFKKHQQYLKDNEIFDLTPYDYHAKYLSTTVDEESLCSFIERSHEIAAEHSKTHSNTQQEN